MSVKPLCLLGSYARSQETPQSDLDFLVEYEKKTFNSYIELKEFLENLFNPKVDLVLPEALKPRLRQQILSELIVEMAVVVVFPYSAYNDPVYEDFIPKPPHYGFISE